jgi:hypothetical protein
VHIWRPGFTGGARPLDFRPLDELIDEAQISLSGGEPVLLSDWPAVFISSTVEGSCTSTLIGPNTVLTAAHCVDAGLAPGEPGVQALGGTARINGQGYRLTCMIDPRYLAYPGDPLGGVRSSFDYGLCSLDRAVDVGLVRPESIDMQTQLAVSAPILMTGYGCTEIRIVGSGTLTYTRGDPKLRMNNERISQTGQRGGPEPQGVWVSTIAQENEPTLCPGDSGGPVVTGATLHAQTVSRRVAGVNSAVGWAPRNGGGWTLYSWMAPLATPEFRTFLNAFLAQHPQARICGHNLQPGLGGCRA